MPISSITREMVITAHDDYVEKKTFSAQLMILEVSLRGEVLPLVTVRIGQRQFVEQLNI